MATNRKKIYIPICKLPGASQRPEEDNSDHQSGLLSPIHSDHPAKVPIWTTEGAQAQHIGPREPLWTSFLQPLHLQVIPSSRAGKEG